MGRLPLLPPTQHVSASVSTPGKGQGMGKPLLCSAYSLPTSTVIDTRLILGAGLFGLGWGISGICPGPALVNLAGLLFLSLTGVSDVGVMVKIGCYVASMIAGMKLETEISKLMAK